MFAVQAKYEKGSREYQELDYRIKCGQLFQQNSIDKAKGIISKPMPMEWHDRHSIYQMTDAEQKRFYLDLVADKKPYFMRLIYPALMKSYNTYVKSANKSSLRQFNMSVDALESTPEEQLTEEQLGFLTYYHSGMPVETSDCVINRICRRFEEEFDGYLGKHNESTQFDYSILKSGAEYSKPMYWKLLNLYEEYNKKLQDFTVTSKCERIDDDEAARHREVMLLVFKRECAQICPNKSVLCDILLDICYKRSNTKSFAWDMCGDEIIENLLRRSGGVISYPMLDQTGEIEFAGDRFTKCKMIMEESYEPDHG
jgi:hypothetical protein